MSSATLRATFVSKMSCLIVVEIGLQVKVDNAGLVADDRVRHTINCLVGFLSRAIAIGAFLEIGFKDRFE